MTGRDDPVQAEIRSRLAVSRHELSRLFDPPPRDSEQGSRTDDHGDPFFPRSRTMKMLMGGRGLGMLAALAGGLFIARPGLALRLLRRLPTGTVVRMVLAKSLGAWREGKNGRGSRPR